MATVPTNIQQLQAQLPGLQQKASDAMTKYNASLAEKEKWRTKALWCDGERAKYSLGSKKEKACSMADRGTYYNNWTQWENNANADLNAYNIAQANVDKLNKQIDTLIKQATDALNTDPTFNLQQQQLNNNAAAEAAKLAEEQKTKRILYGVGFGLGGLLSLFGIFKFISWLGNRKSAAE